MSIHSKICKLLQSNTVLSLKRLRLEFNARSRSSFFRDLKKLNLITSYTHAGQYHAFSTTANYNDYGLWFYDEIGFSKYGTLKNTLIHIISNEEIGMTHKELKSKLCAKVQNTLTTLVKEKLIDRKLLYNRNYLYLNANKEINKIQLEKRLNISNERVDIVLPSASVTIEILVEVIRIGNCAVDEKEIGSLLRQRGIIVDNIVIGNIFGYYDIKKN